VILLIAEKLDLVVELLITVFMIQDGSGEPAYLQAFVAQIVIALVQRFALIIDVFVLLEDVRITKDIV